MPRRPTGYDAQAAPPTGEGPGGGEVNYERCRSVGCRLNEGHAIAHEYEPEIVKATEGGAAVEQFVRECLGRVDKKLVNRILAYGDEVRRQAISDAYGMPRARREGPE